uniref:Uncharacterized protein n=1 Tax=Chromera velia CCMP2878 TaxID=1169474 RepID=A0A0G4F791_9ALVE|eukprot:Cvel_15387.t1-p1 / transcript=Cvel_15387.t1 / gene=Cvel_15387 / organism=Chromera_velia_CCMP2878 / gene_product=hypothetical protein / transcript_product=hypothetical protein / location=Cvel_scaffold1136:205-1624(-) / protein_length=354 / sequence_SO=supercontig / SO=protein_coding / is_pseudo=false
MGKKQGWVLTVHRWIRVCFARDMLGGNCLRCWIFGFAALAGALVVLASLSFALTALGSVGVLLQKGLSVWGEGGMDGIQLKETGSQGDRLPTFRELLSSGLLDFRGYSVNSLVGKHFAQYMIDVLTPYVEMPPVFDNPAERCLPPTSYFQANCSANERHWGFFTGERRSRPKKIVDMFMMGYDLDILDVRFFELDHAVDLFVLLEYSQTNYKHRKPYLFEKNKARYSKYLHKILHVVVPDSVLKEDCPPWPTACWEVQVKNRFRIWEHFGEWNRQQREKWEALKGVGGGGVQNNASMSRRELQDGDESVFPMFFEDDDLMLFSDPDEIPAGAWVWNRRKGGTQTDRGGTNGRGL